MHEIKNFIGGSKNPVNALRVIDHNLRFAQDNPDYFYPAGIWIFCGPQGSGKTLSMIQCLQLIVNRYPKALIVSNLHIRGIDYIPFTDYSQIESVKNGVNGVIFVLDEIQVIWNSMESRNIPISEMACFCQMRKDRRVILGTAQVYSRISKPIREQLQYIVDCHSVFGFAQQNYVLDPANCIEKDGHLDAELVCKEFFFHTPELYKSYDTLKKIEKPKRKKKGDKGVDSNGTVSD